MARRAKKTPALKKTPVVPVKPQNLSWVQKIEQWWLNTWWNRFWWAQEQRCLFFLKKIKKSLIRWQRKHYFHSKAKKRADQRQLKPDLPSKNLKEGRPWSTGRLIKNILLVSSITIVLLGIEVILYLTFDVTADLPDVATLASESQRGTTKIYDRDHHLLYSIYVDENRTAIPLSEMGDYIKWAAISIEDSSFYSHHGFSIKGMFRAAQRTLGGQTVQGGSTITQQLVKNRLLNRSKTLDRKIKELVLAILVEGTYSKDQILEMYLNDVSYGGVVYGVEQAAVTYFGKNAKNLTLGEAAYLAGITTAPSVYSPYAGNLEAALRRRDEVLRRMLEDGYVTAEEVETAKNTPLKFQPGLTTIEAPHFVMYVRDYLVDVYGVDLVYGGGLEVVTTLDLNLQKEVQDVLQEEMADLVSLRIGNGAVLITNPQTGEILTMLGSKNYWDTAHDGQMNVTTALRQPGSSIKPLTYALAFMNGKTPGTIIEDTPFTHVDPWSKQVYAPKNYDGKFHGRVTLRESLGSSYNIPAVKLLNELGTDQLIDFAQDLGISTWEDRDRFGLSLALGAGEVKMTELATAYGAFANGGKRIDLNPLLEVRNEKGDIIYQNVGAKIGEAEGEQVMPASVAYQVTDVLKDNQARTPGFGSMSVLNFPDQEVAVKTGTTNSMRDNWTIGYTTDRLVSVWVGNNDNRPMSYVASGITGASPIWQKSMKLALAEQNQTAHKFSVPNSLTAVEYCGSNRRCGSTQCSNVRIEWVDPRLQNIPACNQTQPQVMSSDDWQK